MGYTHQAFTIMHLGLLGMILTFFPMLSFHRTIDSYGGSFKQRLSYSIGIIVTVMFVIFSAFTFWFVVMYFTTSKGPDRILQTLFDTFKTIH